MSDQIFSSKVKNYRKNELLALEIEKCYIPSKYSEIFGYEVISRTSPKFANRKLLKKTRHIVLSVIRSRRNDYMIYVKGTTLGGIGIRIESGPYPEFKQKYINKALSKWSKLAYRTDQRIIKKHDTRVDHVKSSCGLGTSNSSKRKKDIILGISSKEKYVNEMGYNIIRGPIYTPLSSDKKVLVYTFFNDTGKIQLKVDGVTLTGENLSFKSKGYDKTSEIDVNDSIEKWSEKAYDLDIKKLRIRNIQQKKTTNNIDKVSKPKNNQKEDRQQESKSKILANSIGYDLKMSDSKEPANIETKTLVYSLIQDRERVKILVSGITESGQEVKVETKSYDKFEDSFLVGAIRKWKANAKKLKLKSKNKCKSN